MLTISFYQLHVQGGMVYMFPIFLMWVINLFLIGYLVIALVRKQNPDNKWLEAVKQIGGLAAAWGTWSTIIGLFYAFDAIENATDVIPFPVICGGLKVASITVLYGLLVYCLSLLAYIVFKLLHRNSHA